MAAAPAATRAASCMLERRRMSKAPTTPAPSASALRSEMATTLTIVGALGLSWRRRSLAVASPPSIRLALIVRCLICEQARAINMEASSGVAEDQPVAPVED
eukprot:scaffold194987_cov25-Tisochrysis_lutea.AAC.1